MRKIILTMLLATSAALPAMAQDQGGFGRHRDPGAQSATSDDEARPARVERVERADRVERQRPQVSERANWSDRGAERQRAVEQQAEGVVVQRTERQQGERAAWQQRQSQVTDNVMQQEQREQQYAPRNQVGGFTAQSQRQDRRDWRSGDRSLSSGTFDQSRDRQGQVTSNHYSRDGYQSRRSGSTAQWSSQWRRDGNYDWRRHRDRNRSTFRLGYYHDPYGSRYRRFSIGFSLFPSYYQSNYWLEDPWMYRLPPAYGPYRWVRYYGDALLVNIYTGQVVDVVYDFFW